MTADDPADLGEADLAFLLGHRDRAAAMADRLRWTAARVGLGTDEARRIGDVFLVGMRKRMEAIDDDHDPAYLHPARTALILMDDVGMKDPAVLAAAVLYDASRPDLATPADEVERLAGSDAAAIARLLPPPGTVPPEPVESLVTAPEGVLALYLAARLDHARHLHLGDSAHWTTAHERVTSVLIPLAHRCHAVLARRFERWAGAFARRFLDSAR